MESSKNISELENKYNYGFILLLDSTKMDLIKKTGYLYIDDFRDYAAGLSLYKQTIGFVTDKEGIKDYGMKIILLILFCLNFILRMKTKKFL